jgi:ParB-like chromosome segregation protein Spo0J
MHTVHPDAIVTGERDREDLGDLTDLKASITAVGLLHPIAITSHNLLVAGGRRLAAVRELGWDEVPVTIVDLTTVADVLRAEADENTCRKPLTPYEASKARQRRAKVLSEDAERRAQEGRSFGGKVRHGAADQVPAKLAESRPAERETRKLAATGTGYSGTTLDKVDKVVQIAEQGTITVGRGADRREKPVPPEVQAVAQAHVEGLKKTGAAVDAADKAVSHVLSAFIDADPDVQAVRYRHEIAKAFLVVRRSLLTLDPVKVAQLQENLVPFAQLQDDVNKWFASVGAALRDADIHSTGKAL